MLPYLIAGAIGYAVAKIFEDDKTPKYADGGDIDYSNFKTSVIALLNKNKVLILQRGSTANWMPNKWSIVGGVIEEGEVPIEAMIRECEEEIGLKPSNVYYDHKIMTNDSGEIYYFLGTLESRDIKLDYENSAYKFISKDEINNYDFVPYVKEFILEIFSRNEKKSNFKRGGDILLAPNGKPSNLTFKQYKLVRTPEFKAWFGDWENDPTNASKVVDENGEPLPVYHGTNLEFNEFDYSKTQKNDVGFVGKGFYFTPNKSLALAYAERQHDKAIWSWGDNEEKNKSKVIVKSFFLSIKNAKVVNKPADIGISYYKSVIGDKLEKEKIVKISDNLKKQGYQGVIWHRDNCNGCFNGRKHWEYVAFEPNQIKLADGSNTTFDGNNPDIRFKKGGSVGVNNDITYEIIDDEFGFLVLIKNNNEKIGEIFFEKDRDNSFTITDAVIDTKFKGNRIYPNAIIEILNRKPNITINSVFRSSDAEKSWDYLLKNLPKNIQQKKQHFKDENTTLYQISVNKNTKYDDGGSILLAPNGKPSNLTPEQYKLVRTPAFKQWFGDWENSPETSSKVVDENGEPLVMYSGSPRQFTIFESDEILIDKDDKEFKPRFWFTIDKEYADSMASKTFGTPTIYICFLNIRNPKYDNFNLYVDEFYDGSIQYNRKNINVVTAINSNQIKLADGTNTTFDGNNPDIRFKKGGEIKDLIVLHNINEYQIKEANKLGGLVTPSIAIIKSGNSFTDFGSITLVGTKELIDTEKRDVKVFAGDVYSPSVPRKLYYVDKRLLEKITNELIKKAYQYDDTISKSDREIYHLVYYAIGSHTSFEEDINRMSFNELLDYYYDKSKIVYIVDKSIKIKVPMKPKRNFLWNNVEFTLTDEQIKRFAPILREYTKQSNDNGSNGVSQEIKSQVYDLFLEVLENIKQRIKQQYYDKGEQGDILYKIMIEDIDKSFEKYVGTRYDWSGHTEYKLSKAVWGEKELDKEKLNQNIKKVFTKNVNEDYKEWLSDFISQFQGSSYFLKGNEKMPYTLDNLVDATSNKIVGQEKNMTFGVNQAKSFGTKRLNSIDEIKKNSDKIVTKEEMNLIDEKNKDKFFKLSESLNYEYSDTWGKLDSLGKALADYFKGTSIVSALRKNEFKSPSSYQITLFEDFAYELKNSPVDYFEAKYQRAVSLKEFKYAVVPKNTSKEIIQILTENGLLVKKYETDEERLQIINKISEKDKSIKFREGGQVNYTELIEGYKISLELEKDSKKKKLYQDIIDGYQIASELNEPKKTKSIILAPNGKPSNLTPEQYKLVRTPAFKKWFGDWENSPETSSKVVDENGEPLVVYHGSDMNFNVFDLKETRFNYLYFAVNREYAEKFGKVKSYFINARKIKDVTHIGLKKITRDKFNKLLGFKIDPPFDDEKDEFWQHLRFSEQMNNLLRWNKYDGVKYIEDFKEDKSNIETEAFAILNPRKIKLADGTNTTFDGNNPDIRYAGGGRTL